MYKYSFVHSYHTSHVAVLVKYELGFTEEYCTAVLGYIPTNNVYMIFLGRQSLR